MKLTNKIRLSALTTAIGVLVTVSSFGAGIDSYMHMRKACAYERKYPEIFRKEAITDSLQAIDNLEYYLSIAGGEHTRYEGLAGRLNELELKRTTLSAELESAQAGLQHNPDQAYLRQQWEFQCDKWGDSLVVFLGGFALGLGTFGIGGYCLLKSVDAYVEEEQRKSKKGIASVHT
ncbi:MAG: hypothetical protein V1743_00890 [Nanoarchaeota archaeon]